MKALNDFGFTLNILAATTWLSVGFFLKNFFAWFIAVTVDDERWTVNGGRWTMMMMKEKRLVLTRKEDW